MKVRPQVPPYLTRSYLQFRSTDFRAGRITQDQAVEQVLRETCMSGGQGAPYCPGFIDYYGWEPQHNAFIDFVALTAVGCLLGPGGCGLGAGRATLGAATRTAAANTGSRLAEASSAAFRAADEVGDWTVSAKHLPGAGGRYNKWAEGVDINRSVANALRSEGASFLPNTASGAAVDSFVVRTNLGTVIGTKGQTAVKVVVSNDGRIITAYPVK